MFGSIERQKFDQCGVKTVEYVEWLLSTSDKSGRRVWTRKSLFPENKAWNDKEYEAVLHCPRTEDDRVSVDSEGHKMTREVALTELRKIAASVVCKSCVFSGMTEVEVSRHRTIAARAETERLEAYKIRDDVLAELAELDPVYREVIED